jgi:hypothetical protein
MIHTATASCTRCYNVLYCRATDAKCTHVRMVLQAELATLLQQVSELQWKVEHLHNLADAAKQQLLRVKSLKYMALAAETAQQLADTQVQHSNLLTLRTTY